MHIILLQGIKHFQLAYKYKVIYYMSFKRRFTNGPFVSLYIQGKNRV